jgi:hypothetical protein
VILIDGTFDTPDSISRLWEFLSGEMEVLPVILLAAQSDHPGLAGFADEMLGIAEREGMLFLEVSAGDCFNVPGLLDKIITVIKDPMNPRRMNASLLWRGSEHRFRARSFHAACDGHAHTLTVIFDTDGHIFGGFTPIAWESGWFKTCKEDRNGESFIFSLKNSHFPGEFRKFSLKDSQRFSAISFSSRLGPCFGNDDILIPDRCDVHASTV